MTSSSSSSNKLTLALYRACLVAARNLSREVERHKTPDVFTPKEGDWFHNALPGLLSATRRGVEETKTFIRNEFRLNSTQPITQEEVDRALDVGFTALSIVNQRIGSLQQHAAESFSDRVTDGVRVTVNSEKREAVSQHFGHVFSYRVRIINEGVSQPVQLISRHWIITDSEGAVQEVIGPGVRGEQPILERGQHHEYSSYAILKTKRGTMRGTFSMFAMDSKELFDVAVGPFALTP